MKRFAILAAAALFLPATALADTTVLTPKAPASKEDAAVYVQKLESAIKRECRKTTSAVLDIAYYQYRSCLSATRADIAKKDPTGLYAKSESMSRAVLAAR